MTEQSTRRLRHLTRALAGVMACALVAVSAPNTSRSAALAHCGDARLSLAQIAARRGISLDDARLLMRVQALTGEELCTMGDDALKRSLRQATTPKPDSPGEYLEWRKLSLVDETGAIDPNGLVRAKDHLDELKSIVADEVAPIAGISRGGWSSLGPGNVGGRIRALAIHPTEPETMFVGSVSGGIWKTMNGGLTWTVVDDFMANLAVSSMVINPVNPLEMYAGTGEGFYNGDGIRGAGVFKSTDGGTTWAQLPATSTAPGPGMSAADFYYVTRLAISPDGAALIAITRTGIFRSTNSGSSFTRATMVGGGAIAVGLGIMDGDFHPTDSTRAVASTFEGAALYSLNGGATWSAASGLPGDLNPGFGTRVEVAYAPSAPLTVYAGVDLDDGSLYKSTDGGQSYVEVFDGALDISINPYNAGGGGQGWYDNLVWVSPTDPNLVVWGGIDLFRSTDGGASFNRISRWQAHSFSGPTSAHADQHVAVPHPGYNGTSNRIVFFGNDGGIYRASDITTVGGGATPYQTGWTELNNGLGVTQFYGGAGNATTGRITGGTQDNGTLFYDPAVANPSENWRSAFGGDGGFSAYDSGDGNYFYGEYVYALIHRNTSGGTSASSYIYNGITDAGTTNAEFIAAFRLDPNNNNRLLVGTLRVWRSNDAKAATPTWATIKNELGTNDKVTAIGVAAGNSDIIFAGHNSGKVYKTTQGTAPAATVVTSWTTIDDNVASDPLPDRRITRIVVDPNNSDVVYATFGGFSGDNVYKSINGGASWTDITGASGGPSSLPDVPVRALVVHPANSNFIYVGTEVGIFASADAGATWGLPHDGPSNVPVDELFMMGSSRLVAVTHGRGMFSALIGGAPPTIEPIADQAGNVGSPLAIGLSVGDPDTPLTSLTVTGSSSNTSVLSNAAITFSGTGTSRTATLTPAAPGTTTVTIVVSDGSNTASRTFTLTVTSAPTNLTAVVRGNHVTFTWTPSATPGLSGYALEAGATPGTTFISLPVGNVTTYEISAPSGVFFVRVRALVGGAPHLASNEIEVRIGDSALPGAPTNLLANADGSALNLAWHNTEIGGTRSGLILQASVASSPDVVFAELPLSASADSLAVVAPAGSYSLRVVANGPAGRSAPSNAVVVTVPATCAVPATPQNLRARAAGSAVTVTWDLGAVGTAAPVSYVLEAGFTSGAADVVIATSARTIAAAAPPGTYHLRVRAVSPCGVSANTGDVVLNVP